MKRLMWCLAACFNSANAMYSFTIHDGTTFLIAGFGAIMCALVASL